MAKTPFNAQQDLIDKRAVERAEKIDETANEFLQLLARNGMSVNDAKLVFNMVMNQIQLVFDSRLVKEFMPEPEKGDK